LLECNISQLNHVFLNIIMNAAQAIDGHGRVKVSTAVFDGCVCVAVKDNGAGIAPEILPHIFDAYFTTKPAGGVAGTGLGLSIAKDIVEQHGGKITVKSIVGKGSTFVVYLPMPAPKSDSH
jgi:two-component system, NtrC family, sensor kinase